MQVFIVVVEKQARTRKITLFPALRLALPDY